MSLTRSAKWRLKWFGFDGRLLSKKFYRIEPVATELTFPVGVTFDDKGTAFVVESGCLYGEVWITPRLLRIGKDDIHVASTRTKNRASRSSETTRDVPHQCRQLPLVHCEPQQPALQRAQSDRSAVMGLTRIARRAGTTQATRATAIRRVVAPANVALSDVGTS
jgi:hypothetical protein